MRALPPPLPSEQKRRRKLHSLKARSDEFRRVAGLCADAFVEAPDVRGLKGMCSVQGSGFEA